MRLPSTPFVKFFTVIVVVVFFTLLNYGCQQSGPTTNKAVSEVALPSPSPIVIPPWPAGFPKDMPTPVVSGNIPVAVNIPPNNAPPLENRPFFDNFSWESFIALNWPAKANVRGVPDQPDNPNVFMTATAGTPVVWATYKDSFDLFGQKERRPSPWESNEDPINPCPNSSNQNTLMFITKGETPLMQTQQAFSFPLIDQRNNYVYFDIRYDQAEYNFIRGQDSDPSSWLYLLKNLQPKENAQFGVQMPMSTATPSNTLGSIMLKAAWRIKTDKDDASRFYNTTMQIYDPVTQKCTPTSMLLVGLHIAHKVDPFTEWVWSTFEQVDNVPPDPGTTPTPTPTPPPNGYSFNNGTNTPKTVGGYNYKPAIPPSVPGQPMPTPSPVQVTRVNPIPTTPPGSSTREINAYYQQLLKGTVWQYYQLIVTQWPVNPGIGDGNPFKLMERGGVYPQNAGGAFPVNGAVNVTMETYFQTQNDAAGAGGNGCMSCHYRAGQSDFSWGLNRRAH